MPITSSFGVSCCQTLINVSGATKSIIVLIARGYALLNVSLRGRRKSNLSNQATDAIFVHVVPSHLAWPCPFESIFTREQDQEDRNSSKTGMIQEEEKEKPPPGYFWALFSGMRTVVVLLVAIVIASMLCFFYIICSVLLWVLGIYGIYVWLKDNWEKNDRKIPKAMPGQEKTDHWVRAWQLAHLRNNGIREEGAQANFHVVPLLKSKTGLDMQHLARLSKARDAKTKSEKELVEVDRNLPDARIDLEHLLLMVKSRAEQKWKDSKTNPSPVAQPPVAPTAGGSNGNGLGSREGGGGGSGGGCGGTNGGGGGAGRGNAEANGPPGW